MQLEQNESFLNFSELRKILSNAKLKVNSLEYFNNGWDFNVYLLNGSIVIRIPKTIGAEARLRGEMFILKILQNNPFVCVPDYQLIMEDDSSKILFVGYPLLEGKDWDVESCGESVFQDIIKFISWLHKIHNHNKIVLNNTTNLSNYRNDAKRAYMAIKSELQLNSCSVFEKSFDYCIYNCDQKVIIHNDLRPEHILIDPYKISIIDWTDIAWAYPWEEFLWWWLYWGDKIFPKLKRYYVGWCEEWIDNIRSVGIWKLALEYYNGLKTLDATKLDVSKRALNRISNVMY